MVQGVAVITRPLWPVDGHGRRRYNSRETFETAQPYLNAEEVMRTLPSARGTMTPSRLTYFGVSVTVALPVEYCRPPTSPEEDEVPAGERLRLAIAGWRGQEDEGGDLDESGLEPKDVELVMSQASCSRSKAVKTLRANGGKIVSAIMELTPPVKLGPSPPSA